MNKYQLEAPTIFIEIVISPSKARSIRNAKSKATKSQHTPMFALPHITKPPTALKTF